MGPRTHRTPRPPGESPSKNGWTLLEIVLAVAIAGLLLTVVLTFFYTASTSVSEQPLRRSAFEGADRALAQLGADLTGLCTGEGSDCALVLKTGSSPAASNSEAAFCTVRMPAGETDLQGAEIRRVTYRVLSAGEPAGILVCEEQPVAGPGAADPPVTNWLAGGVEHFQLEVFDGAAWLAVWSNGQAGLPPRAARMDLALRQGRAVKSFRAAVTIPAGGLFTARVERVRTSP